MNETSLPKRMRLYLIRHGEVEATAAGKLIGRTDVELSPRGLEQANELAAALAKAQLATVYSSDLRRARTTANIIARHTGSTVGEDPAWREINMGQWEGRSLKSLYQSEPQLVSMLLNDHASFEYPGGESFSIFVTRVRTALKELHALDVRGELALVTHGGVCRAIIGAALEIPPHNWLRVAQDYGCLNVIDWYDGNPTLCLLNSKPGRVSSLPRMA